MRIVKAGDQIGQGVGYLDDGTMVVVEQGRAADRTGGRDRGDERAADAGRADDLRPAGPAAERVAHAVPRPGGSGPRGRATRRRRRAGRLARIGAARADQGTGRGRKPRVEPRLGRRTHGPCSRESSITTGGSRMLRIACSSCIARGVRRRSAGRSPSRRPSRCPTPRRTGRRRGRPAAGRDRTSNSSSGCIAARKEYESSLKALYEHYTEGRRQAAVEVGRGGTDGLPPDVQAVVQPGREGRAAADAWRRR